MPQFAISVAAAVALVATVVYLHALFKLHAVVAAERPEWVDRRGALSFFYDAFPAAADPNIGLAVVRIALGGRFRELQSPLATTYAKRIRWCPPLLLAGYLALTIAGLIGEP